jgi:Leucine-rich repeat (LRR) protein
VFDLGADNSLTHLSGLQHLDFGNGNNDPNHRNRFVGPLPLWLEKLSGSLTSLSFYYLGSLEGSVDLVAKLTSLTSLEFGASFGDNKFTGTIDALAMLSSLTSLDVGGVGITGTLPSLASLTNLQLLGLNDNHFTGPIDGVKGLTSLTQIDLWNNQFTGPIDALKDLTKLTLLLIHDNHFTGPIDALKSLTSLTSLLAWNNNFNGTIDAITHLTKLTVVSLVGNQFTGTLPSGIGLLTDLLQIDVRSNQLIGTIPSELGLLTAAEYLRFGQNPGIYGTIPTQLANLNALTSIDFDGDSLYGPLPNFTFAQFTSCCALESASNYSCPLPPGAQTCVGGAGCSGVHPAPKCGHGEWQKDMSVNDPYSRLGNATMASTKGACYAMCLKAKAKFCAFQCNGCYASPTSLKPVTEAAFQQCFQYGLVMGASHG